jgi:hypothetical protein
MATSETKPSTPKLSEAARHFVIPAGAVTTGWPDIANRGRQLGLTFDWWQDSLGRAVLAKRKDGKYAATVGGVVLSIPRQVGKTWFVLALLVIMCIHFPRLRVLWTAHHNRTATNSFRTLQGMCRRKKIAPHIESVRVANGEQEVRFTNGSMIMFGAREQGFGRGFDEIDVEVFDEAQILNEKALEDMVAATNQARHPHGALLFYMGTPPRPVDPGEVFSLKRNRALSGKTDDMVYLECSADSDADPDDREQWAIANFSFPTRTPLESMLRLRENLGSDEGWLREGLGVWQVTGTKGVIPLDLWTSAKDEASVPVDQLAIGIEVAPDRVGASVAFAGRRQDQDWHLELTERRDGVEWLVPYVQALLDMNPDIRAVVADAKSMPTDMVEAFTKAKVQVTYPTVKELGTAHGQLLNGIVTGGIHHIGQPPLTLAVSMAGKRKLGDTGMWVFSRATAGADITPIQAATLALLGAQQSKPKKPVSRRTSDRRAVLL